MTVAVTDGAPRSHVGVTLVPSHAAPTPQNRDLSRLSLHRIGSKPQCSDETVVHKEMESQRNRL
jgi:hypothetical protein